jgi:uncharacterized membrane-anchored protein YitT (DUF2179 family)
LKQKALKYLWSYAVITVACVIYAIGFNWCYEPNNIAFGGVTGIAQIINAIFSRPSIGLLIIIINIPLFLAGWKFVGRHLMISSLYAMGLSSLFIDLLGMVHQFAPMEPLLASIYGGVLMGLSLGLVFQEGATTGGSDIVARLLKLKMAWLPMGKLMLGIDLTVIVATAAVFKSLNTALYGMVALYIATIVMDGILYGVDRSRFAYIITEKPEEIAQAIIVDMDRGVTILQGKGGYSGEEKQVLLCAFKERQIVALKKTVKQLDASAFLIVCDAHEVLGDGFREYHQNDL